jgi:thioredoxin reductase
MDAIVNGDGPGGLRVRVYAVGRVVGPQRSQAIISAGAGAAAAIDILSTLKGEPVQDWDAPPENK